MEGGHENPKAHGQYVCEPLFDNQNLWLSLQDLKCFNNMLNPYAHSMEHFHFWGYFSWIKYLVTFVIAQLFLKYFCDPTPYFSWKKNVITSFFMTPYSEENDSPLNIQQHPFDVPYNRVSIFTCCKLWSRLSFG